MTETVRFLAKFFKDMFSKDPWKKFDPELKLKFKIMDRIGTWEVSRLSGILQMYNAFEQDFFKNDFLLKLPEDNKIDAFIIFINNFSNFLFQNKLFDDAEIVSRISTKIKNEGNSAYCTLAPVLFQKGKYQEALIEAGTALKVIEKLELQSDVLPVEYKKELGVDDKTSFEEERQLLYELIRKCKESI